MHLHTAMITELYNFNLYFQIQLRVTFRPRVWSIQEAASGVKRMTVCLLPRQTAPTKSQNQGRGKELEQPGTPLMICPGRTQVPEPGVISSMQVSSVQKPELRRRRLLHGRPGAFPHSGLCRCSRGQGLRPPPSPTFTSGSTPSFPLQVVCPG